jgi:hypothetical protein
VYADIISRINRILIFIIRLVDVLIVSFSDASLPHMTTCSPTNHARRGRSTDRYTEYEYSQNTAPGFLHVVPQSWHRTGSQSRLSNVLTVAHDGQ